METTKLVASPRNFNSAKIEMEEQEKEEKKLRKLLKKEKDRGERNSPSPERKLSIKKMKKSDAVNTRDLRT